MDSGYVHPKDKDLPGFTRDSRGRPKPGYHNPTTPGGAAGVDAGLADVFGGAMFGHEHWELRKRRARRYESVKSVTRWVTSAGCLLVGIGIVIAALLGLAVLIRHLWGLL